MDPVFQRLGDVTIQRLEKPKENKLQPQQSDEDTSEELPTTNKRPLDVLDTANKKFRADETFSDEDEFSDYDSESEMESEVEEEIAAVEKVEDKVEKDEVNSEGKKEECGVDGANGGEGEDYDYDIKEKLKEMGEISVETVKKGESKVKKSDVSEENEVVVTPAKKSGDEDGVAERKGGMLRRNIREVMDETKLDESTLAAQRQEMERLKRVNEQQRFIREVQRQLAQERMQNRVISLLQGNNTTKPVVTGASSGARIGNTVLVKLPNGQTKPMTKLSKRPFELLRIPKGAAPTTSTKHIRNLISMKKPATNLTPSVSIAPVSKKLPTVIPQRSHSDSDSEDGDEEFMRRPLPKPKPRPLPVPPQTPPQTIDISSDDDCIVVSETEGDPNTDEVEEDPSNSGMHTNDEFNQPDDQGRVVINIGHPEDEPDIYVAPQIARIIKPHQVGGVRFLFDNLIESIGRFESSTGFGCILAHSMGLGKTLQVVCFSDVFLRHTPARTILCIMPINTLQNWMAEFNMWLPTEEAAPNSPLNAHGEVRPRNFNLHVLNDSHKTLAARAKVIHQWKTDGGVLLIGYEQYRLLSMRKYPKSRKKQKEVERDDDKNKALFDEVHEALVKPGPDLVICDEGHRIKNSHASISQALKQMRTKRRVVLTGYPLQNNLMEYWCMVDFVRPNYLGTKTEFCNMFERPIQNGQCIDSTEADIKLMRYRAHVLHSLLVGFVQRRSHTVLQTALPQKQEYVLLVRMTPFQRELYETFMNEVVRIQAVPNPLKAFAVCCKIWNHPDVLYYFLKKRDAVDIDLEEVSSTAGSTEASGKANKKSATKKATKTKVTGKPEASVTPYSTTENQFPPPNTITSSNSNSSTGSFSSSSFGQSQSNNINPEQQQYNEYNHNYFHQTAKNKINYQNNYSENSGSCYSGQNFGQNSFGYPQQNSNFQQQYPPSYNNYNQQHVNNYWNQDEQSYQQTNDYYNNCKQNFNSPTNWIKKEDIKPLPTNTLINPIKSEGYNNSFGGDSKPKINIISDIKLSSVGKVSPEKKINILSDIKLEVKKEEDEKDVVKDEVKSEQPSTPLTDDDVKIVSDTVVNAKPVVKESKEDGGIPYDWATELLKDYIPGCIENSAKMEILFTIIRESIALGDRLLVFSQSLITLDLIEQFLQSNQVPGDTVKWCRNTSYYRLDGSTSALEREKLINEFNSNAKIHLFLVSTRAGSLGINLIGANRVVVLDASWNPCHDTQAVCRVYRYGQQKPCYVYRLVVDNCLEKKIYDRQINKQGMSDRVVDECNPDAHLTLKDVSTLCWDDNKEDPEEKDWSHTKDNYSDPVLKKVLESLGRRLNKEPFQHESLLVDRKDKQLSRQEKRLAKKGYEREKQASRQPMYNMAAVRGQRPIASVRPMQQGGERPSRWIPAEHWQRQGMTAQEMTLPLDVVIPTNQQDKGNIVLKAGQKVLVLKSPKGVYMQLESGKIVAIKTAIKVRGKAEDNDPSKIGKTALPLGMKSTSPLSVMQPKRTAKPFNPALAKFNIRSIRQPAPNLVSRLQNTHKKLQITPKSKPYTNSGSDLSKEMQDVHLGLDENESGQNDLIGLEDEETGEIQQNPITEQHRRFMGNPRNFRPNFAPTKNDKTQSSALQRLEQSTSAMMSDKQQPFQDTLDSITNATYHEEDKLDDHDSRDNSMDDAQDSLSDDVQHISDDQEQQPMRPGMKQPDIPQQQQDYTGYNYYNYNPYPAPPQTYPPAYHPTQAGYEMGYTPQPPPPPPQQYGYGMYPQSYAPPQVYHQPPHQPGFEYGHPPAPPQAMYPGYHNPYQQQYGAPPPPPPIYGAQPAPAAASSSSSYPAPEYQYGAQTAPVQQPFYPNT